MTWIARLAAACRALLRSKRLDRDLDDELQSYLEASTDALVRDGMTRDDAARTARANMGSVAAIKDHTRDAGWESTIEGFWQDVRYAARALLRAPGFSLTVFATLAIAIGGNTAIFQLADAVRLRPLPVEHPEAIVEVRMTHPERGRMGRFSGRRPLFTYALWDELRQRQRAFTSLAAWSAYPVNVAPGNTAQPAQGLWVNGGFFKSFGIAPHLGRLFDESDDQPGCGNRVAVLSHAFWTRQYGGDPGAIGRTIALDRHPFEIVGVAPRAFTGLEVGRTFDVATPLCAEPALNPEGSAVASRTSWWLTVLGRLAPGWTTSHASAHLASISGDMFQAAMPTGLPADVTTAFLSSTLGAYPASTGVSGTVREEYTAPLSWMFGLAVVVLIIASANIATLLLARATVRERDAAVRLALGASRGRLIRQLLSESVLLAVAGAIAGALIAQPLSTGLVKLLQSGGFQFFAVDFDLQPNRRVLMFTIAAAAIACLMFGLVPAVLATRPTRTAIVRGLARTVSDARSHGSVREMLVTAQISLALMLVVAALLLSRTFRNLAADDPGLEPDGVTAVVAIHPDVPIERRRQAETELLAAVRAVPEAQGAATAQMIPLTGESWSGHVIVDGIQNQQTTYFNRVSDGYFATLRTRLISGRDFSAADGTGPRVAIVNASFACNVLGHPNPIGATFELAGRPGDARESIEVIGVVADAKHLRLRDPFEPMAFFPLAQVSRPPEYVNLLVRLASPDATRTIAAAIGRLEPNAVLFTVPLREQVSVQTVRERLLAVLSSSFAAVAALLALLGLYGLVSYSVTQRSQEIGIRMALGASGSDVIGTFLRRGLLLSGTGVLVGLIASALAAPYLESLLFGLNPREPSVFIAVAIAFPLVAIVAAYVPARRATNVDPVTVLRGD
jgi:putative ABC transport system permease protein